MRLLPTPTRYALAALLLLAVARPASAQELPDTLRVPAAANPLPAPPAAPPVREGRLEHPVRFAARDSLVIVFGRDGADDVGTLFGEARATYDEAELTAHEIDLLFERETLRARGLPTDTGLVGRPAFRRGAEGFTGRELAFNLATERGRIVDARTQVQDGILVGGVVKQADRRTIFAQDVIYTTCDLEEHAHWGLHTHRLKLVDGEWVYTGPAQLYLLGIPTPLWLPFGFFPSAEGRRSGPLPPTYGEQQQLGFFLNNLGYYWAISDYLDLEVAGGLYTSGSFEVRARTRYARQHLYTGSLALGYNAFRRGEPQDPAFAVSRDASLRWQHSQTLDAAGTTTLSGNVDLRTGGTRRLVTTDYRDRITQQTTSAVTFQRRWRSGRNINVSYNQNLNLTTGNTTLTLPTIQFNQPTWYPLRGRGSRGQRWYEQISLSYRGALSNRYTFTRLPENQLPEDAADVTWIDGLFDAEAFRRATGLDERFQTSAQHNVPLAGRLAIRQLPLVGPIQLDVTPSLTYREEWFTRRQTPRLDADGFVVRDTTRFGNPIVFDTESAFTAVREATLSIGLATQAFGTVGWRIGRFDGFRHTLRPSVSLNFSPDYEAPFWGRVGTYTEPDGTVVRFPVRREAALPGRAQQTLGIAVSNTLQTRLLSEDETGAVQRQLLQLLAFDVSTSLNLAAPDTLGGWAPIRLNARTDAIPRVNVSVRASFSPHAADALGQALRRSYFSETGRPLRFLDAAVSLSTQLRGGQEGRGPTVQAPARRPGTLADLDGPAPPGLAPYDFRRPDLGFVDFSIPWSLNLDLSYGITRNPRPDLPDARFGTLNAQFDVGLTPTWRISGNTGFDFERGEIVSTQLSVLRDLHCFEMSATWIPFGPVRAFSFSIYVKSGQLRDILRLNVPNVDRTVYF